jgi:hypothetical protein
VESGNVGFVKLPMKGVRIIPNYVYNNLSVRGSKEDLIAFRDKAGKQHTTLFVGVRSKNEKGEWTYDETAIDEHINEEPLSFWNFVKPEDEILPIYFGHEKESKPEGYEGWTTEQKWAHDIKFSGNDAYNWNIRNWGTKWDAGDVSFDDRIEDETPSLYYNFQTAWSIPEAVFQAMVEQHPTLEFSFYGEEEQGWGAEYKSSDADNGERSLEVVREWDIPQSHQDYVDRDEVERCNCQADPDDTEYWYDDCPRGEQEFVVVVERRYIVKAESAEKAWDLAQEKFDELTPEDLDSFRVVDENTGEHLFPMLTEEVNA